MKRDDCIVDCVGPDCEGCKDYKTAKSMETNDKKPTKEEILQKYEGQLRHYSNDIHYVRKSDAIKAMQEYADLYHKEMLREELIKFAKGFIVSPTLCVDEYLKTKE